jgi:hypothetical protein
MVLARCRPFCLIPANGIATILCGRYVEGTEALEENGDSLLIVRAGSCA